MGHPGHPTWILEDAPRIPNGKLMVNWTTGTGLPEPLFWIIPTKWAPTSRKWPYKSPNNRNPCQKVWTKIATVHRRLVTPSGIVVRIIHVSRTPGLSFFWFRNQSTKNGKTNSSLNFKQPALIWWKWCQVILNRTLIRMPSPSYWHGVTSFFISPFRQLFWVCLKVGDSPNPHMRIYEQYTYK